MTQAHLRDSLRAASSDIYASGGYSMTVPSVTRITHVLMNEIQICVGKAVCEIHHDQSNDLTIAMIDRYGRAVTASQNDAEYRVELTACFVFSINTTLEGPRGLSREELEELIENNWQWVSIDTDVLLESHWELDSFEERSSPSV
jgi:hypothetical protein